MVYLTPRIVTNYITFVNLLSVLVSTIFVHTKAAETVYQRRFKNLSIRVTASRKASIELA